MVYRARQNQASRKSTPNRRPVGATTYARPSDGEVVATEVMTPEEVLLEAIAAASLYGDSLELRREMCNKLRVSENAVKMHETRWGAMVEARDDGQEAD